MFLHHLQGAYRFCQLKLWIIKLIKYNKEYVVMVNVIVGKISRYTLPVSVYSCPAHHTHIKGKVHTSTGTVFLYRPYGL